MLKSLLSPLSALVLSVAEGRTKPDVFAAEAMPGALRKCELCERLEATDIRLHAAVKLRPLFTDLVSGKDFAKPNELRCSAKPTSYADARRVCERVGCAVALQARCRAQV